MHQSKPIFLRVLRLLLGAIILLAAGVACTKAWGLLLQAYDDQSFYGLVSGISFVAFGLLTTFIAWLVAFGRRSTDTTDLGQP
ncbi:MAG: hypothetical protein V4636_12820 [Pseudomonadota bacterium]